MRNIYDATDDRIREIIEIENLEIILNKTWRKPGIEDLVLVRTTNTFPIDGIVEPTDTNGGDTQTSNWTLNGEDTCGKNFIIIEPFQEQINNPNLVNINELNTWFAGDVKLSKKATILISEETYKMLCYENPGFKEQADKLNIALFRGDEKLAFKILLYTKKYVSFEFDEKGFIPLDQYGDSIKYIRQLKELERLIAYEFRKIGRNVSYGNTQQYYEDITKMNHNEYANISEQVSEELLYIENLKNLYSKMITGLTPEVEGDIELDGECFASTGIGKVRENQEDAVLLIKDKKIPGFRMMVVADGMGGEQKGEIASHIIVTKLKAWFESLSEEEKETYYEDVTKIDEELKGKIQQLSFEIDEKLHGLGGSTIVCAITGKSNTLVLNVGDSRAYIIKDKKLEQVTVDDAIVQEEYEKGNIPFKDAMRFHYEAAGITQYVGMGRIEFIHSKVLKNNEYSMLLLFSDGVTDCLSEEDIAIICNTSDRKEIANQLVQKAIENDSIAKDELIEYYTNFNLLIPGGKDNTSAVSLIKEDEEEER